MRLNRRNKVAIAISSIILVLGGVVLLQNALGENEETVYSLSDMETKAQDVMNDGTLSSFLLSSDNEKDVSVYLQKAEIYGTSNRMSYVIYHLKDKDILLQDASLSLPEYVIYNDGFIYICGRTTAFSTVEGINITRYRITEDCVVIENAIDGKSLNDRYYVYQDEDNETLVSIIPKVQDGMGRIYFEKVEETTITATEVIGSVVSNTTFEINSRGKFALMN